MRGDGTSYAYLPPRDVIEADPVLVRAVANALRASGIDAIEGGTWTTDAPFRETRSAIATAADAGFKAVEMEAAALYAYAAASGARVVCLAHITNTMATDGDDFEKGDDNGVHDALAVARAAAVALA